MKGIMIQGTSSDAGKSFLVTALCRIFSDAGLKTCPYKSQNMSNNSYVTLDGCEIGRAQGVQAEAARQEPNAYMNPILLKPKKGTESEIVLFGKVFEFQEGNDYYKKFTLNEGIKAVRQSLKYIEDNYDVIVIEGAGSPVEMNLNDREIVNMRTAREADVPVILVTDIDRGGSFGSIVGTLELLGEDRKRVKGIIFNKFRGDISLFEDGVKFIEAYTGVRVVGVMPYLRDIRIENEDNLSTNYYYKSNFKEKIIIGVVNMPYVSNNTDIEIFRFENDIEIISVDQFTNFNYLDAVIIPGTKSTIPDMKYLNDTGISKKIKDFYREGGFVFGICGGYQILGEKISDDLMVDNNKISEIDGISLLPVHTNFEKKKVVKRVWGFVSHPLLRNCKVDGYEIHLGVSRIKGNNDFLPLIKTEYYEEGLVDKGFKAAGTYLHNIFHNDEFRNGWLNIIRKSKGYQERPIVETNNLKEKDYDALAKVTRDHLDIEYIFSLLK
ncbi:MAG: cobyric acid synthase [Fusobacteria bacterium]|nr:cobyric acid synthase [Fusobacteriota bacterium]